MQVLRQYTDDRPSLPARVPARLQMVEAMGVIFHPVFIPAGILVQAALPAPALGGARG